MNVLVCFKRVPAPGARINLTADERAVDSTHLGFTTSPHEECAVEAAVQLVEAHGGSVTVLTLGPTEAEEQLRYAVSVGAAAAALVPIEGEDWDPQRTSKALTAAITELESAAGAPFDLLLFGNESADAGGFQVGVRVARALGRPMVNGAKGVDVADGQVTVRRETDGGLEVYVLPLPAAVGVKEGIALPRYPTMKGRLASKKAAVDRHDVTPGEGGQHLVRLARPVEQVAETTILGDGPDAAAAVVDLLVELGALRT